MALGRVTTGRKPDANGVILSLLERVRDALLHGVRRASLARAPSSGLSEASARSGVSNELDDRAPERGVGRRLGLVALAGRKENAVDPVLHLRGDAHAVREGHDGVPHHSASPITLP